MYSINVIIICYYCWSLLLMLELCQGDETTDADVRIAPIILILSQILVCLFPITKYVYESEIK